MFLGEVFRRRGLEPDQVLTALDGGFGKARDKAVGSSQTASNYITVALGYSHDPGTIEAAGTIEKALEIAQGMEISSEPSGREAISRRMRRRSA